MINEPVENPQGQGDMPEVPPGAAVIQVTVGEREAIERLKQLGFSEAAAIQAYFACDKDENQAANLLFQEMEEDGDMP